MSGIEAEAETKTRVTTVVRGKSTDPQLLELLL